MNKKDIYLCRTLMDWNLHSTFDNINKGLNSNIKTLNLHLLSSDAATLDESFCIWNVLKNRPARISLTVHIHCSLANHMGLLLLNANNLVIRPFSWIAIDSYQMYCKKSDIDEDTPTNTSKYLTDYLSVLQVLSEHLPVNEICDKHILGLS